MKDQTNKMGTQPINRLMLAMGLPIIVSMMLQAVYNIVDSMFVGKIPGGGEAALNALTLAFPVQMLMVAVGIGTGVGVNALVARSLGASDREKASCGAGNGLILCMVIYVVFALFGIFGVKAYISSQTSNSEIAAMAVDYLRICCVVSVGIVFFSLYEKLLQSTGHSGCSTIAQIIGAVVNIILDPIMIYGWFGLPAMGARGAAWATVIGQIASFVMGLIFHLKYNREIENRLCYLRPSLKIIGEIYSVGLPAIIAQALMSAMTYGMNVILGRIDEAAVTAYGLYYKIQQFILFAAFGLRDAITPIVSFNFGMGSRERVNSAIRFGLIYTLGIMAVGLAVVEILAQPVAGVFGLSGGTRDLCVGAMRLISISFLFAGVNIAFQGIFQALDSGLESLVVSVCRQFLFVLPVAWLFARLVGWSTDGIWLVWLTFFIAEGVSMLLSVFFMRRIRGKKINTLMV